MAVKINGNASFVEKIKEHINVNQHIEENVVFTQIDDSHIEILCNEQHIDTLKQQFEQLFNLTTVLIGKTHRGQVWLNTSDVSVIEAFGNNVETQVNQKSVVLEKKLYEYEEELEKDGFIRIGKSTLINSNHIESVASSFNGKLLLYLKNEEKVYVNRSYTKHFKDALSKKRGI